MAKRKWFFPIDEKIGKLTVLREAGQNSSKNYLYECICECGNTKILSASKLGLLATISCGCILTDILIKRNTTHNLSNTSTYKIWKDIRKRCLNINHSRYPDYGGRGISICDRWLKFENFLEDMCERPSKEYSIDRIDNNKSYYKENCRWSTDYEQSRNKRTNRYFTINNETLCLKDWCDRFKIDQSRVNLRLKKGIPIERALLKDRISKKDRVISNDSIR